MRKNSIPVIAMLLAFLSTSLLLANPFSDAVSVNTISTSQTVIHFSLPDFKLTEHIQNNITFAQIEMEDAFDSGDTGLPDMPHFSATIAVPIGSTPTFTEVTQSQPRYMQTLPIAPVQNYDAENYTFDYNSSFYQSKDTKTSYPKTSYFMTDVQTLRDYQFVVVKIYPIKYIPAENTIEIIDSFQFTINHQSNSSNPTYTVRPLISQSFERIYEHTFQNYDHVRSINPTYQTPSIVLIYGGTASASFMSSINNIVNLKRQMGFHVTVANDAIAGSTTANIKSYIQNLYNSSPNPPEWIILVGNNSSDPYVPAYLSYSGYTDYDYTFLAGGDLIGDAFIGRISVSNDNELNTYWLKMQRYELNSPTTAPELYKKTLLVGDARNSGISTYLINRYIKSVILEYEPTANIQEMYYGVGSQSGTLNNNYSAGHLNFNFRGYSGADGFSPNAENTNILTNSVILTCGTGTYYNPGTTEGLIRRSYNGTPAGAILATGMSTSATHTKYNNVASGGIFYAMYAMDVATMGEAILFGKAFLMTVYPGDNTAVSTIHWANLMGDPSLYIFKTTPKTFATTLPTAFPAGTQSFRLVITDVAGNNVPDAWVTISNADGSYVSKAISDASGVAYLPLDHEQAGPFFVAISKPGFYVKRGIAAISGNNNLSVIEKMVNDPAPGGNGNQTVNPGETMSLTIKVKNFTTSSATNLFATITTDSEFVTLTGNTTTSLGTIGAGLEALYNSVYTFTVSPLTPDKELLPFTIFITDNSSSWTSHLLLETKGIDLKILSTSPASLNIGNSTQLNFTLKNEGTMPSGTLQANLVSLSPYLTAPNNTVNIPTINVGATATLSSTFTVNVTTGMIAGSRLKANLHIFNSAGYEVDVPVDLPIGNKVVGDPSGPDDYGYIIYHSSDTDTDERPTYNWVNIANIGTNTGMTDVSASQEEDKRTVNLPFFASFYGELYDRISICSNGWIVFGETEQKDFRNVPLPGAVAPRPLIAPFWTDLVMGGSMGGGVYTYHHPAEHAFIIQYDKAKWVTGYSGYDYFYTSSDTVSFQVLIYDPMYNGTVMGDSKIKIQYRKLPTSSWPSEYTVGIQNQTSQTGLQYVFNSVYSPGSNSLTNNSALLITAPNVIPPDSPHLVFGQVVNPITNTYSVNYGTAADLQLTVRNVGSTQARDVHFTLDTASTDVNLLVTQYTANSIPAGADFTIPVPFSIIAANNVTDQTVVPFYLFATAGTRSWQMNFFILINAPKIELISTQIRNSSGVIVNYYQPGNTGSITLNFKNNGHLSAESGLLQVASLNPLLTLTTSQMNIPALSINATSTFTTNIQISNATPLRTVLPVSYLLNAQGQILSGMMYVSVGQMNEGFESGNFSDFPWNVGTNLPWVVVTTNPASGTYCAQSNPNITHSETSALEIPFPTTIDGEIQFQYRGSTEGNYDFLRFYINGAQQGQWSGGFSTWQTISYPVSASNSNVFKWEYTKDGSVNSGDDKVWIDNIVFPAPASGGNVDIPVARVNVVGVNFGTVQIYTTATSTFTLANLGNATLTGSITLPDFCTMEGGDTFSVPPLSSVVYTVSFYSEIPGEFSDVITIETNDTNTPVINIPVSASIDAIEQPYLVFISAINPLTESNAIAFGAHSDIVISVRNLGLQSVQNVNFTLSTSSPDATIDVPQIIVPSVAGVTTTTISEPFTITVIPNIADLTELPFTLTATTQDQTWEMNFTMIVYAPKLQMVSVRFTDSEDQSVNYFNPGDDGTIYIDIQNTGHYSTQTGMMYATTISPTLTLDTSQIEISEIEVEDTISFSSAVHIDSQVPRNTMLPMIYAINTPSQILTETVNIPVGQVLESFEIGDFSSMPWVLETDRPWTVANVSSASGQYCAHSYIQTPHDQSSTLEIPWPTNSPGIIQFSFKVSSEPEADFLEFYIGDTLLERWSGTGVTAWRTVAYPVSANVANVFKWRYTKNGSLTGGQDRAWIDNILFPTPAGQSISNAPITMMTIQQIDFGVVDLNTPVSNSFTLQNIGSANLTGTIALPQHYSLDSEPTIDISPFSTVEYTVTFSSNQTGNFDGTITITTNDPINPQINISLRAETQTTGESDTSALPVVTALKTNYPNPFNPSTSIAFDVAKEGLVSIEIYNIKGQRVKTLVNTPFGVGSHKVVWNGEDATGRPVSSGVYFYRMTTDGYVAVKKMLLMK